MLTHPSRRLLSALTLVSVTIPLVLVSRQLTGAGGSDVVVGTEEAILTHAPAVPPPILLPAKDK